MPARTLSAELMDDPALDPGAHRAALRGLSRLNRFGAAAFIDKALADLYRKDRPLRVLDVATGGGDIPIALHRRARRRGMPVELAACDLSPVAIEYAREQADERNASVEFFELNALHDPIPTGYDALTCSLFLHHLIERHAVELLQRMAAAAERRVIVSDLARSPLNGALVSLGSHLVTTSRIVHTDAKRSMAAAFTLDEARALAEKAGLRNARVEPRFPARYLIVWDKR